MSDIGSAFYRYEGDRSMRRSRDNRSKPVARIAAVLLVCASLLSGCSSARQLHRFFFTQCPEDGPYPERSLDVFVPELDHANYSRALQEAAEEIPSRVVARVPYRGQTWPIYHYWQRAVGGRAPAGEGVATASLEGAPRLLVVAGAHGNESAGALAAMDILDDIRAARFGALDLDLVAPANPVGFVHGSRYNADGCDINRDFAAFRTTEARAVRDVIEAADPDLILSLHEGPNDGFLVIATRETPARYAAAVVSAVRSSGIELAGRSHLGSRLEVPGVMNEGWFIAGAKWLFRIHTLGTYASGAAIPLLTTEGPWHDSDIESRVRTQVIAVRAAADELVAAQQQMEK